MYRIFSLIALAAPALLALSLEQSVALALQNNDALKKEAANADLARAATEEERAKMFGSFDLQASYTHYNLPRTLAPLTPTGFSNPAAVPTTQDIFSGGVAYTLPLFTGFAQQRSVEIARLQEELADIASTLSRRQLSYNVRSLYLSILSLRAQHSAQSAYTDALQQLLGTIEQEIALGKRARVEHLKAAADLESARARLSQIASELTILKAGLAALLSLDTLPELEEVAISPEAAEAAAKPGGTQIETLQRYRSSAIALEKSRKGVEKSSAAYYPQVALGAYYGRNFGPNDAANANSGDWNSQELWQAGISVSWNIFDFGGKSARAQKAKILQLQSTLERSSLRHELKRSLTEALSRCNAALDAYRSAHAEVRMSGEAEEIETVRYENGAVQLNDLLYAKARHQLALGRSIDAGYRYQNSRYYLDYLLEKDETK